MFIIHTIGARLSKPDPMPWLIPAAFIWLGLGLIWRILSWMARAYILTDQRIIVRTGIFRIIGAEIPLRRIQHTTINRSLLEQVFNLGTLGIATAGADGPVINLLMVPNPNALLAAIRETAQRTPPKPAPQRGHRDAPPPAAPPRTTAPPRTPSAPKPTTAAIPVIGLAGGIGSGKSEVARILASLGCLVTDSDLEARQALDRPEVRAQLVAWWGLSILGPDGTVNRKAVADIVFKSPDERARLESLIHPLLRARRANLRAHAREAQARAAVIDAPLLFEAGVDAECDAVIFVDASRTARLARIASRGWDEAELTRRESAQLPLEEKQRRSTLTIHNDSSPEALRTQVAAALDRLAPRAPAPS